MLALCLMLSVTYYAQNYAGIIGWSLAIAGNKIPWLVIFAKIAKFDLPASHLKIKITNLSTIDKFSLPQVQIFSCQTSALMHCYCETC